MSSVSTAAARTLLVELVSTPSVSGDEGSVADVLVDFFEDHGREAWLDEAGNVRAPGDDGVLLTSHLDTVPGEIPVRVESTDGTDVLWGRGSVDATGSLAAMAAAAVRTGASFAGVVREETDSRGARVLLTGREEPDAVLNGEPSGWDAIALGYRGLVAGEYTVVTDGAHGSRPEPNAIQHAVSWWQDVEAAFDDDAPNAASDATADAGSVFESVTATPLDIAGGSTADGLAVEATVSFELRVPPGMTPDHVETVVEDRTGVGTVDWTEAIPPVEASPRTRVGRALRTAIRAEDGQPRLLRKTGTCDMNLFASAWDCPMATYGPGDSALDHAPDERLSLASFDRSLAVLTRTAQQLTGDTDSVEHGVADDVAGSCGAPEYANADTGGEQP